ncbi:MAG: hypothetical protein EBX72_11030, partial [Betaproteobacteria bacterium]|nr:hypothetical protein [Betaproteobacteria bacterium]
EAAVQLAGCGRSVGQKHPRDAEHPERQGDEDPRRHPPQQRLGWIGPPPISQTHHAQSEHHLAREGGSMTRVAERTGLERTHLYRKLKQLGVELARGARRD